MNPGAAEYFRAIEEEFVKRRGAAMLLSPRDWALMGEWREAGIPLSVVLQGIRNVFDAFERRAPAGRRINSLSYCRQEVLSLFDLYRAVRAVEAGRPTTPGDARGLEAVVRHVGRLARRVKAAMAQASEAGRDRLVACLARAAAELKRLRREIKSGAFDLERLEERLAALDAEMTREAQASLPAEEQAALHERVEAALRPRSARMGPEARTSTRQARLSRLVRDACGLPRLSLFD